MHTSEGACTVHRSGMFLDLSRPSMHSPESEVSLHAPYRAWEMIFHAGAWSGTFFHAQRRLTAVWEESAEAGGNVLPCTVRFLWTFLTVVCLILAGCLILIGLSDSGGLVCEVIHSCINERGVVCWPLFRYTAVPYGTTGLTMDRHLSIEGG